MIMRLRDSSCKTDRNGDFPVMDTRASRLPWACRYATSVSTVHLSPAAIRELKTDIPNTSEESSQNQNPQTAIGQLELSELPGRTTPSNKFCPSIHY